MVTVENPNSNKLRSCLDPKDINVAIQWEHFELPTVEEITARMAGAKVFSKIDLNHGCWQQKLDEESQLLTTFNTSSDFELTWLNVIADKLSRLGQTIQTEWSLHPEVFQAICSQWHQPQVDLFATRVNTKLPRFVYRSLTPRHG